MCSLFPIWGVLGLYRRRSLELGFASRDGMAKRLTLRTEAWAEGICLDIAKRCQDAVVCRSPVGGAPGGRGPPIAGCACRQTGGHYILFGPVCMSRPQHMPDTLSDGRHSGHSLSQAHAASQYESPIHKVPTTKHNCPDRDSPPCTASRDSMSLPAFHGPNWAQRVQGTASSPCGIWRCAVLAREGVLRRGAWLSGR